MRAFRITIATLALTLFGAGCGGGGSTSSVPPAPAKLAPASSAKMALNFKIPRPSAASRARRSSPAGRRSPSFISPAAFTFALYDGSTLVYVGDLDTEEDPATFTEVYASSGPTTATAAGCTTDATFACEFDVTSTAGPHSFDVVTYPIVDTPDSKVRAPLDTTTPPTFSGIILSEGQLAVNLVPGPNTGQTLTLLGVAGDVSFFGPDSGSLPAGEQTEISYEINDAAGYQILQPGAYDNGPVTITAGPAGDVTMTPVSQTQGPAVNGAQTFDVTCTRPGATITFTASASSHPDATYTSGLTYSASNYPGSTLGSLSLSCEGT
jgi:hypothetical protein